MTRKLQTGGRRPEARAFSRNVTMLEISESRFFEANPQLLNLRRDNQEGECT